MRGTLDHPVDVIKEEAMEDYNKASGISEQVDSSDDIITLTRARLPWLLIGLMGGIMGAQVMGIFDIQNNIELAFFTPLIAAMGGNVGVQSAAIIVQGLASNSLGMDTMGERLLKELGVQRNEREAPELIRLLHNSYASLQVVVDAHEIRCETLERENLDLKQQVFLLCYEYFYVTLCSDDSKMNVISIPQ